MQRLGFRGRIEISKRFRDVIIARLDLKFADSNVGQLVQAESFEDCLISFKKCWCERSGIS